jgi:antibiotic biosynthesis monooxygenase (ABM) superfamily enzyme
VIERHITFNINADKAAEFERFIADTYRTAMSQAPGFVRAELLREADDPTRYQMTFRFEDTATAAGWRTSAVHQALQPDLAALSSTSGIVGYDVIA